MATRWIDFTELKRQVSIRDVLTRYGLVDKLAEKKPGRLIGACPIHGGKNGTSFNVDTDKNVFNCFSQCGGGNVLDLVMKIEDCSIRQAGEKLSDWYGLTFERRRSKGDTKPATERPVRTATAPAPETSNRSEAPRPNQPLGRPLTNLNPDHPYLVQRGLTVPTIRFFGVGYCTRGLMRGRIAIPIHDEAGALVAYAGRAIDDVLAQDHGKYRLPDGFKKSFVLFNLHRAAQHADRGLILVEGYFDAMKVHQAGFPNVVALMGSKLTEQQEQLLIAATTRLTMFLDGDEPGRAGRRDIWQRLSPRLWLRNILLEPGQQPDDLTEDQLRTVLS